MAGLLMGFAQKDASQRVNRVKPISEWVDLEPLAEPLLPPYPMHWYQRELRAVVVPKHIWDLWRSDPVTSQWAPGDLATVLELGQAFYDMKVSDRHRIQTSLGLNASGRRQLRWRIPIETERAEQANAKAAEVRRLRIVHEEAE